MKANTMQTIIVIISLNVFFKFSRYFLLSPAIFRGVEEAATEQERQIACVR